MTVDFASSLVQSLLQVVVVSTKIKLKAERAQQQCQQTPLKRPSAAVTVQIVMKVAALVLFCAVGAFAACESDPDHTNEGLFYQSCKAGEVLRINTIAVTNVDGSANYPINVDAPIHLKLNFTNTGSQTLDNIYFSASVARYTDIFGFCSWIGIPTFGLTDHLDGCNFGSTPICPFHPGTIVIDNQVDLSPFQAILNILSVSEPYRLTLSFKTGSTEIACATVEAKIRKG